MAKANTLTRFEAKIDKSGECWMWTSTKDPDGYGRFQLNYKHWFAHRLAYQTWVGPLEKGKVIMHKCDTPSCVNPDHLLQGTTADNNRDMFKKKRNARFMGENNPHAKLTDYQVDKIRSLHSAGLTQHDLALTFNVTRRQIHNIVTGLHRKEPTPDTHTYADTCRTQGTDEKSEGTESDDQSSLA